MLKFEFVQHSEFDDPEYYITDDEDGEYVGFIYYLDGGWMFMSSASWGIGFGYLLRVVNKINELNRSTKQQRILGVF